MGVRRLQRGGPLGDDDRLNHKGSAARSGRVAAYASVTDLVLDPPAPLLAHWQQLTAGLADPLALLGHFTLVAEDLGPDACLGLLS